MCLLCFLKRSYNIQNIYIQTSRAISTVKNTAKIEMFIKLPTATAIIADLSRLWYKIWKHVLKNQSDCYVNVVLNLWLNRIQAFIKLMYKSCWLTFWLKCLKHLHITVIRLIWLNSVQSKIHMPMYQTCMIHLYKHPVIESLPVHNENSYVSQ